MMLETDSLVSLKDDMVAFIEGHGMFRFPGYVDEAVASVPWDDTENPDSWKDFVEAAKAAGAQFLTMSEGKLEKEDLEILLEQLHDQEFPAEGESPEMEEAEELSRYIGKSGYIQLGFAHQGIMFLHESTTEWYERYQGLANMADAIGDIVIEDDDRRA